MKLKNKKTGEIKEVTFQHRKIGEPYQIAIADEKQDENGQSQGWGYKTLAELNDEWEDYEEPKRYWIIDTMNDCIEDFDIPLNAPFNREIGNYFETREDAEKAVEKLKAWKRLKDKGFKFLQISQSLTDVDMQIILSECQDVATSHDMQLLFGGKE